MAASYLSDIASVGYAIGKSIIHNPKEALGTISGSLILLLGCQPDNITSHEDIVSTLRVPSPYANETKVSTPSSTTPEPGPFEEILTTLQAPNPNAPAIYDPNNPSATLVPGPFDFYIGLDCYSKLMAHYKKSQEPGFQNSPEYFEELELLKDTCSSELSKKGIEEMSKFREELSKELDGFFKEGKFGSKKGSK